MNIFDGIWMTLFFLVSGVLGALIGRIEKTARKTEYFKSIPGITEE